MNLVLPCGSMVGDGVHLFEPLLMNITEAAALPFRLPNFPFTNAVQLVCLAIMLALLGAFLYHLGFDFGRFFTDTIHDPLCFNAEIRFGSFEAEIEAWRTDILG